MKRIPYMGMHRQRRRAMADRIAAERGGVCTSGYAARRAGVRGWLGATSRYMPEVQPAGRAANWSSCVAQLNYRTLRGADSAAIAP